MEIKRWSGGTQGRSTASAYAGLLWLVSNASDVSGDFCSQTLETFALLDTTLQKAGSSRKRLLSVQVLLADIAMKPVFDILWKEWIGTEPTGWPQRACFQVGLTPGLLIEITAVATRDEA